MRPFAATYLALVSAQLCFAVSSVVADTGKIFWAQGYGDAIASADLGGQNVEELIQWPLANAPISVTVDPVGGKIYWAQTFEDRILRANLDGTNVETLLQGPPVTDPVAIDVDPVGRKIYWAQSFGYSILRADLDGHNPETLLQFPEVEAPPVALAVDSAGMKFYWAQTAGPGAFDDMMLRADLDGSNVELLLQYPQLRDPVSIAVDSIGERIYWAQTSGVGMYDDKVLRAALTGGDTIETILVWPQLIDPVDIALDSVTGKVYWAQTSGAGVYDDRILRANLDGGDTVETVLVWPQLEDPVSVQVAWMPDVCELPAVAAVGCRYIEIVPSAGDDPVALLVTGDPRDSTVSCVSQYAQHRRCWNGEELSETICTSDSDCAAEPGYICDFSAALGDTPLYMPPAEWGAVAVRGEAIRPDTEYNVQIDCGTAPGTKLSYPVSVKTWPWGETNEPDIGPAIVDFGDISRIVDAFKGYIFPPTLTVEQADLMPCTPNRNVNFIDVSACVDAFKQEPFHCPAPCQ